MPAPTCILTARLASGGEAIARTVASNLPGFRFEVSSLEYTSEPTAEEREGFELAVARMMIGADPLPTGWPGNGA
jgi:hypothetical protein